MLRKVLLPTLLIAVLSLLGCGQKTVIYPGIPDAENSVFSEDGTLYVSGSKNVYKIKRNETGAYNASPLLNEETGVGGMAINDNILYIVSSKTSLNINYLKIIGESIASGGNCKAIIDDIKNAVVDKKILYADLNETDPDFNELCRLDELLIPNGMAIDSQGRIYVADETFLPNGKILRVNTTTNPGTKEIWMNASSGALSPNGIVIKNDILYFTDLDLSNLLSGKAIVKRVDINAFDYGDSNSVSELYKRSGGLVFPFSLFDDLTTATIHNISGVVVTDYNLGTLLFIEDKVSKGKLHYETNKGHFASPSSVIRGMGPDFSVNQLLVTEKGLLMIDPYSDFGNKLVSVDID